MRIASWNVNWIRARIEHVRKWLERTNASHSMGVKTALIGPITAGREGHVECPESEPANEDTQFNRSRMVSAPDCTGAWDQSLDRLGGICA
jgi:hypothetical protein